MKVPSQNAQRVSAWEELNDTKASKGTKALLSASHPSYHRSFEWNPIPPRQLSFICADDMEKGKTTPDSNTTGTPEKSQQEI